VGATNPFSARLADPGITRLPLPRDIERPAALGWRYVSLGLADVDLSFAGRRRPGHAIHGALERLDYDSLLQAVPTETRSELCCAESGQPVGALAKNCRLPAGQIIAINVDTLVRRLKKQSNPEFAQRLRVEAWWVPLATVTIAPNGEGQRTDVGRRSKSGACADASVEATVEPGIEVP